MLHSERSCKTQIVALRFVKKGGHCVFWGGGVAMCIYVEGMLSVIVWTINDLHWFCFLEKQTGRKEW